jgi:hypothetical protein
VHDYFSAGECSRQRFFVAYIAVEKHYVIRDLSESAGIAPEEVVDNNNVPAVVDEALH